jgi:integrase/recombinase XerD
MGIIHVKPGENGRLTVQFNYSKARGAAIKAVPGKIWHQDQKAWSIPATADAIEQLRSSFTRDRIVVSKEVDNPKPKLSTAIVDRMLARFDEVLTSKGYSQKTRDNYRLHLEWFLDWFREDPATATERIVEEYIFSIIDHGYSASYTRQAKATLALFYAEVIGQPDLVQRLPSVKTPKSLPFVLSKDEVQRLLAAADDLKHEAIFSVAYSAGLRVNEVVRLKISDILSDRNQILVRGGKGSKDRYTLLSQQTLHTLRAYFREYQPVEWLFPGMIPGKHISVSAVQRAFQRAREKANLSPKATMHSLRHSFATHLHEAGVDIRYIQELLGHDDIRTTAKYTKVSKVNLRNVRSPLDELPTVSGGLDDEVLE